MYNTQKKGKKKIYMYAVVPYENWSKCPSMEGYENEFDYWDEGDYQVFGIVVDDQLLLLEDNVHAHIIEFFNGIVAGLKMFFNVEKIYDVLYLNEGVYEYDSTKVQEAIYKKWKSGN